MCPKRGEGGEEGGRDQKGRETGKRVLPLLRRGCAAAWGREVPVPGRRELEDKQAGADVAGSEEDEAERRKGERRPKGRTRSGRL